MNICAAQLLMIYEDVHWMDATSQGTAFLAPDLVEARLQGRRSAQLTVCGVLKQLPWDWNEQRRRFGRAPGIDDNLSVRD